MPQSFFLMTKKPNFSLDPDEADIAGAKEG
jgi:hypothetical protein